MDDDKLHKGANTNCVERCLLVEVDRNYHLEQNQKDYDAGRTFELNELGIKVIRFTNQEVIEKLDFVLHEIQRHLLPNCSSKTLVSKSIRK